MKKLVKSLFSLIVVCAVLLCAFPVSAAYVGEAVLNRTQFIAVSQDDEWVSLSFIAPQSGFYKFYSIGSYDTLGCVADANGNILVYGDDRAEDTNFEIYCYMQIGRSYLLGTSSYEDGTIHVGVSIELTNIESVDISDVTVYEGVDATTDMSYNEETGKFDTYMGYSYNPKVTIKLKNGTVLQSDESGDIELNGQIYSCDCEDDQGIANEWGRGKHTATASIFGFSKNITVTVEENPVQSVVINDVTLYDDWDCLVLDEEWEEILGIEITTPIKIYYYMPSYTVTFKDGTVLKSDKYGIIQYNDRIHLISITGDTQDINNLWQIGTYQSAATIFGVEETFNVIIKPNPMQSVTVDDVTLLKDWDYNFDYEYNPETEEYDLAWKRYEYTPTYTVTLKDGTVLKSDENGMIEYDGKEYLLLNINDGQSYETPWIEGTYAVKLKIFGSECTFNVTLEEMVSVTGDVNRDGKKNNKDLGLIMQYINTWNVKVDPGACDINGDGNVNNKDYGTFMRYLNNWEDGLF